jgi:hypothetical protein
MVSPCSMRTLALGVVIAFGLLTGRAEGQQVQVDTTQPTAEQMRLQMDSAMGMMGPMMGQMAELSMAATLKALSKPEAAEQLATFSRNYYNALIKKGFTKDQALNIVMAARMPLSGVAR